MSRLMVFSGNANPALAEEIARALGVAVGNAAVSLFSDGEINTDAISKLSGEVAAAKAAGHDVIVVTSGSVAAGLRPMGFPAGVRPTDEALLRAASAAGQISLMASYQEAFASHTLAAGQVLLIPTDLPEPVAPATSR